MVFKEQVFSKIIVKYVGTYECKFYVAFIVQKTSLRLNILYRVQLQYAYFICLLHIQILCLVYV
jgi:hypothetical protein